MTVRLLILTAGLAAAGLFSSSARGHAEHEKARYVAAHGVDAGRCDEAAEPCRTIAYATGQAGKGDRILVAGGTYPLTSTMDVFYLTSGIVEIGGGYARDFTERSPATHPTTLVGVPVQFRETLEQLGFRVIGDRKGSSEDDAGLRALMDGLHQLNASASAVSCVDGSAAGFPCSRVDLVSHMPLAAFDSQPSGANDVWGFLDLNTGREYALIGLRNGAAVIDVTDPEKPLEIGSVTGQESVWRDIKVLQVFDESRRRWTAYAYVTTDGAGDRLAVIDLTGLPNSIALAGRRTDDSSAHNVYLGNVDYATGVPLEGLEPLLVIAGSNRSSGAFRAYGLAEPADPELLVVSPSGGYMHDATSLVIDDARATVQCESVGPGCVVLVDYNELSFELWDLRATLDPALLSSTTYADAAYVHSGWWSEDKRYVFVHDELDEQQNGLQTTLRVFSIDDLRAPVLAGTWTGETAAVDHNGYVRGNRYYMSNYTRGLTILDITDPAHPAAAGRFDSFPISDNSAFNGAWGVYPFLPSGRVLVSDINSGLYVLDDRTRDVAEGSFAFTAAHFGGSEGGTLTVTVERLGGSSGHVSLSLETLTGTAGSADFEQTRETLRWAPDESGARSVEIPLTADAGIEGVEQFFVRLVDPRGGATLSAPSFAHAFVHEAAAPTVIAMAEEEVAVDKALGKAFVTVRRQGSAGGAAAVRFETADGTASAGSDYAAVVEGELTWADGDASPRVIAIEITDESTAEAAERFVVALSSASGATLGTPASTEVTIAESDINQPPSANAGANRTVDAGSTVSLDGSQSSDPDGDALSFAWTQTAGPAVVLADADGASPQFTAPAAGSSLVFELSVADDEGLTSNDAVSIDVRSALAAGGGGGGGGVPAPLLLAILATFLVLRATAGARPTEGRSR